jgi:TOMM system kinase/cyclase fusion protein
MAERQPIPPEKTPAEPATPDAAGNSVNPASAIEPTALYTPSEAGAPAVDAAPGSGTADLPTAFGRYRVCRALGSGGFGTVYLGHDSELDRPVAIKVLRAGKQMAQQEAERFLQEARRVARLRHPGVVTVHDIGVQDGQVYIVADYLEGANLHQRLGRERPSWQEAVRLAAAVADALAHAHTRLTIHRDIKPGNIIVTADGAPVLVDFGLGLDEDAAGGRELGIVTGTPAYMSPEQVAGTAHRIDGRTDIYSLGVVLYEMLCGQRPFRSNDRNELMRQVRDDEPQPPRQLVQSIPVEVERVCLKAMAKQVQHRYTTAGDFAEALRGVLPAAGETAAAVSTRGPTSALPTDVAAAATPQATPSSRRRAQHAERRQISVLVCGCDLFQSEDFLDNVDAEDQAQVLRGFRESCERAVHRFGGTVVQGNEAGLLVCFGYPVAYEDAARRAAQTGLNMLEALQPLRDDCRRRYRIELNPWIGIHTGPAIAEMSNDVISLAGEGRNVAVRLEDVAEPGQVVCSEATHRLIQSHFVCEALGSRKLKGLSRPVAVYRIKEASTTRGALEAMEPARLTPLTGRDHEVSLLQGRWEQAQDGMGQIVLLIGEPGLGKSRLVLTIKQFVQEQLGGDASAVVEWRCSPHCQNSSLFPISDFFERLLGFGRHETPEAKFDRLVSHLEEYGLARPEVVPLFATLLSLPLDGRFADRGLPPIRQKEETFRAVQDWLSAYSARRPVLFVLEDLHWIDASTLEFLGQYVAEGLHDRVLTLLTFRPEFKTPWPAMANQTSLALNRLTRRQVGDMMAKKVGHALPTALVDQVNDRSGGVPLFVEEFTQMACDAGLFEPSGDDSARTRTLLAREIPATLQDLIMARLDRMASNREVAQLAATLGREFSYELLAAVAPRVAPLDEPTLQAELAKLVQAELLYPKGRPPKCSYLFKHALLEDAAYGSLVKSKRQQFHRQIAEVLESQFPQTAVTQPELLAYHFGEADLADKAVAYSLQAGLRARAKSADLEAIGHLTEGLALLGKLPQSPERDALELQFMVPLGTAYIATRGYAAPEAGPAFQRARELCERVGQPSQMFAVMWGIWAWHVVRGDFRLCMELGTEAMAFADRLADPGITMEALFMPGLTMLYRGDFTGARDHCGKAVAEFDDRGRTQFWTAHTGQDSGVTHRCYLALALWHLGWSDQALALSQETMVLARSVGHPFSLGYALHHRGWLCHHCRLGAEAQAAGEEAIAIGAEQGFAMWHATGTLYRASGLLLQNRVDAALPLLEAGLPAYRATGAELALPFYLSLLGEAYSRRRRFAEARATFDEALAIAAKNDDRFQEAELQRLCGELLLADKKDTAAAEPCFQRALTIARQQGSKAWELRATLSLARLLKQHGRSREAHANLAAVYAGFSEGFATPDLTDAKTLLDSLD